MKMKQINTHIHTHEKHKRCKTIDNIHVFCWSGQFLEADYTLEQDDPVDKEASYWYCVPKQCYKPKARCKRNIKHCCFVFLSIFFFYILYLLHFQRNCNDLHPDSKRCFSIFLFTIKIIKSICINDFS